MTVANFYSSVESYERQQEAYRMRQKEREQDNGFMKGAIVEGEFQEVTVSATGDVELLEHKP